MVRRQCFKDKSKLSKEKIMFSGGSMRYKFAHMVLPSLALMNRKKFYRDISGRNNTQYLSNLWQGLASRMNQVPQSHLFEVSRTRILNYEAFIIKLPTPINIPEAFFAAVIFQVNKQFFSKTVNTVRYFTLELGVDPKNGMENTYFVCEWAGNMATKPKHFIHMMIKVPLEELFSTALKMVMEKAP